MTDKSSLGDRMKNYENAHRIYLPERMPVIIRVDGKAFHTLTRGSEKPWDDHIVGCMTSVGRVLLDELQGAKIAYVQSDEVSILLTNYDSLDTQSWFGNNLQKMASVSASLATRAFNNIFQKTPGALFDSRVFVVPKEDVCNYFLWRQRDAERNSVSGLAQVYYSHKELHGLSNSQMQDRLMEKEINWNDCQTFQKRGWCVIKKVVELEDKAGPYKRTVTIPDWDIPIFSADRAYIEQYVFLE